MKYLVLFLSCSSLLFLSGCEVSGDEEGGSTGAIGVNGTLTQLGKAATEAECPNGGVTLEHGIDKNEYGQLGSDEILKTYVLCHGQNGTDGSDADVTALQAEEQTINTSLRVARNQLDQLDESDAGSAYLDASKGS